MRETEPFEPITTEPLPPPDAITVELTADEIREALCAYIGDKRGERFTGHAYVGVRTAPGRVEIRVTYWKTDKKIDVGDTVEFWLLGSVVSRKQVKRIHGGELIFTDGTSGDMQFWKPAKCSEGGRLNRKEVIR